MTNAYNFPNDENGEVLRHMAESGDDLSRARDIDFSVVMPNEDAAMQFSAYFKNLGYRVKVDQAGTVPELPWDVVVVNYMCPSHAGVTAFENELEALAVRLRGRNDGWGCFEQAQEDQSGQSH